MTLRFASFAVVFALASAAEAAEVAEKPAPEPTPPAAAELPPTDAPPASSAVVKPGPADPSPVPAAPPAMPAPVSAGPSAPSAAPMAESVAPPLVDQPPPVPRGPIESRFRLQADFDSVWHTGRSYDYFSKNDIGLISGATAGYAVLHDGRLTLVPELGIGHEKGGDVGQFLGGAIRSTSLDALRLSGGASGRYAVLSFLETHVRLAVGAEHLEARLEPQSGPTVEDSHWAPFGTLGAGFTVHTPGGLLETARGGLRTVVLGLTAEGGYSVAPSLNLSTTPSSPVGRIATADSKLGAVERSGPYVRIAVALRF